jgi:G3E family GTPase
MSWDATARQLRADAPSADATHVFIVFDGTLSPVDQLEALKPWLLAHGLTLARVLTVVNCQLAEKHPALQAWFDACIHFSDVVLLNRREGVANKWLSEFRRRYEDQCMPCLFEFVKAGRVKNPAMLLDPTARRLSQYFDASEWDGLDLADVEIGESDDDDGKDSRPLDKNAIDPDDQPPIDPWFELDAAGRRRQPVPDIRKYL